jgi:vitamin B12 transporter
MVVDEKTIDHLGEPLAAIRCIRLTPSASVETGGPAGTLSQVRIRGAEANHTLLFIDGIRANDPAAGNIPRFELLNADIVSRIEVVRGPQSALWGADAIGGVVAVNGLAPESSRHSASAEAGAFGFLRVSASGAVASANSNLAGAVGWQRADGIDSFDGTGDKDGYRNLSARLRGAWKIARGLEIGAAGFALASRSQFDGFNPAPPFQRTDTLDNNKNHLTAGRLWVSAGDPATGFSGTVATSLLGSSNRNFIADEEINRTRGERWTVSAQGLYRFSTGALAHTAIVAVEHDRERLHSSDTNFGGATNQDRRRDHQAATAEWRAETGPFVADLAVRHDRFSAFEDATTVRASALLGVGGGFSVAGGYSEGIAQPTFFDLFGSFPGSFVGNPGLKPERSSGFETALRYRQGPFEAAVTAFRQTLRDEIVTVFDATFRSTTVNRDSSSRRSGLEVQAGWDVGEGSSCSPGVRTCSTPAIRMCSATGPRGAPSMRAFGSAGPSRREGRRSSR